MRTSKRPRNPQAQVGMGRVLGGGATYNDPNLNGTADARMPSPGLLLNSSYQSGRTVTNKKAGMTQLPNHRRLAAGRKHKTAKY